MSTVTGAVSLVEGMLAAVEAGPFSFDVNESGATVESGESGWDALGFADIFTTHLHFFVTDHNKLTLLFTIITK